jgi:hypothetical protein
MKISELVDTIQIMVLSMIEEPQIVITVVLAILIEVALVATLVLALMQF